MNSLVKAAESARELGMSHEQVATALSVLGSNRKCYGPVEVDWSIDMAKEIEEGLRKAAKREMNFFLSPPPNL